MLKFWYKDAAITSRKAAKLHRKSYHFNNFNAMPNELKYIA